MTTINLPFEPSPTAISLWLQSLSKKDSTNSAIELNNIARQLRSNNEESNKKLTILLLLTPSILHNSHIIEHSLLSKKNTSKSTQKIIKLCTQLLKNTSLAFCNIITEESLPVAQQNIAIYTALQLIGYSQRLSTLFHLLPSSTLWTEMGIIYGLAVRSNTEKLPINHKVQGFIKQSTIESVIKRNILFNISNPQQYTSQQIKEIFSIFSLLADKLVLNAINPSSSNTFHWDSTNKNNPLLINPIYPEQKPTTLINTTELVSYMQSKNFGSTLEAKTLTKLIDHLSGYQSIIDTPIPSAPVISHIVLEFKNIIDYLIEADKLEKIQQFSLETAPNQFISEAKLEPIPFEKGILASTPQSSSSISQHNLLIKTKTVKTLKVKNDNYIIAESNDLNCDIGNLVLFCSPMLKLGIIKQVKITNTSGTRHILIEEIDGIPSIHQLASSDFSGNQILSIKRANAEGGLLISDCKLPQNSALFSTLEDSFILKQLSDYTPFFNLYQF